MGRKKSIEIRKYFKKNENDNSFCQGIQLVSSYKVRFYSIPLWKEYWMRKCDSCCWVDRWGFYRLFLRKCDFYSIASFLGEIIYTIIPRWEIISLYGNWRTGTILYQPNCLPVHTFLHIFFWLNAIQNKKNL